jgi:hypothetical protein
MTKKSLCVDALQVAVLVIKFNEMVNEAAFLSDSYTQIDTIICFKLVFINRRTCFGYEAV